MKATFCQDRHRELGKGAYEGILEMGWESLEPTGSERKPCATFHSGVIDSHLEGEKDIRI